MTKGFASIPIILGIVLLSIAGTITLEKTGVIEPISFGGGGSPGSAAATWIPTNGYLKPFDATYGLQVKGLATSTTGCLAVDSGGWISASGSACGAGGGGSGGGTWSTTTSSVSGRLFNYPNNATDIVLIGSNASTTAEFYYDPNIQSLFVKSASSTIAGPIDVLGNFRLPLLSQGFAGIGSNGIIYPFATSSILLSTLGGAVTDSQVPNTITIDLASTATALAANGANCSSGNAPLGVNASGAVESCFDVWTEAENTSAAYISLTNLSATYPIAYNNGTGAFTFNGLSTTTNSGLSQGFVYVGSGGLLQTAASSTALASKQDVLVSGTNIKTINGSSVLGSGDLTVTGSGSGLASSTPWTFGSLVVAKDNGSVTTIATSTIRTSELTNDAGFLTSYTSPYEIATSSIAVPQVAYFTQTGGRTTLGSVATGTITCSGTGVSCSTTGLSVLGGNLTITGSDTNASSTLLADTNTWSGTNRFNFASTTYHSFTTASTTNLNIGGDSFIDLTGTGLAVSSGVLNTSNIPNASLANSTISGIALGSNLANLTATDSTLTFSGTYNGGTARTIGLNLGNANTWTVNQTFNYSSSTAYSSFNTSSSTLALSGTASTSVLNALSVNLFGGGAKTTANSLCVQLTGSADLCDGSDAAGAGGAFPWTVNTGYNSTTTTLGFLNGFFSTASSTISNSFFLPQRTSGQLLYTGTNGSVLGVATSSASCSGGVSCSAFTVVGSVSPTITSFTYPFPSAATSTLLTFSGGLNASDGTATLGTIAGTIDAGGATDFEIPNSTASASGAAGRIRLDTTSNNLTLATSTNGHIVVASATTTLYALTATTSPYISGSTIDFPPHFLPQNATAVACKVTSGTSFQITFSDGTNSTNTVTCTTTWTQYALTTNNSWTANERFLMTFGTKTGTTGDIVIRVLGYRTSD